MTKKTIDETIDDLEGKKEELKSHFQKEWKDLKHKAEKEPVMTLAIVGLVAFVLGWLFGSRRK